jgi:hypothetical protein
MIFPASYYTWPQIIMHIQNKGLFDVNDHLWLTE